MKLLDILKNKLEDYQQPTPKKMRKIGDALLAAATFASTYSAITDHKILAIFFILVGVVGKFITNFYKDPPQPGESGNATTILLLLGATLFLASCCTSQKVAEKRIAKMVDCNPGLKDAFKDTIPVQVKDTFVTERLEIQRDTILELDTVRIQDGNLSAKIVRKKTGTPCDTVKIPFYFKATVEPDTIIRVKEVMVPCPGGIKVEDAKIPFDKKALWFFIGFGTAVLTLLFLNRKGLI